MKAIIAYVLISCLLFPKFLNGQTQECFQYNTFTACNNVVSTGGCPTWADNCNEGWIRSQGTPQIKTYIDSTHGMPITVTYAYMWSYFYNANDVEGEGMFSSYNFMANHTYTLKFRISTDVPNGSVFFYAANGLTQSPLNGCGNRKPNITETQLIGQYNGSTNGTINVSFTFYPTTNYSQIWIYPQATNGTQYNLAVLSADICPAPSCDQTIIYNHGSVPIGETRAGTILAGSSAGIFGFGTVTVNPLQNTSFIGLHEITLLPEFHAVVTTGTFSAIASLCEPSARANLDSINIQVTPSNEHGDISGIQVRLPNINGITSENFKEISVYPSIGAGLVNITGNLQQFGNYKISVYDQLGERVFSSAQNYSINKITLNLGYLKTGLYILQIESATRKVVRKIIISR